MLSHLGRMALDEGRAKVRFNFVPTPKNKPAQEFLESLGADISSGNNVPCQIEFESEYVAELTSSLLAGPAGRIGGQSDAAHDSAHRA
jgi:predicted enzyme involved in methoxymalonyl-ACP biosynthesis